MSKTALESPLNPKRPQSPEASQGEALAPPDPAAASAALPKRKVINGIAAKNQSCGLAIFARETGRCAVVRRRYSFAYYDLLRGSYRRTYLNGILRFLTQEEVHLVGRMAAPPGLNEELLAAEGRKFIYQYGSFDFEQARQMLKQSREEILAYCDHPREENLVEEWTLPKGHLKDFETQVQCAVRECREELGVTVDEAIIDESSYVENHTSLTNGVTYTSNYWSAVVEHEKPFAPVQGLSEVSARAWKSLAELKSVMKGYNFRVVEYFAEALGIGKD
jgi:8-oxo-dGTP pyrophosphatase MutT (NUDIX family)